MSVVDVKAKDWPLPASMEDYCPLCDGVHHPDRHAYMASLMATVVRDEECETDE